MSGRRRASIIVVFGCALVIIGVATFSPPIALILAGAGIATFGLLAVEASP